VSFRCPALVVVLGVLLRSAGPVAAQGVLDLHALERTVGPSVVFVRAYLGGGSSTEGTGVVLSSNGWVVTNQHVLGDSNDVEVWVPNASGYARYEAIVVLADARRDLALVRVDGQELVPARLAPSGTVEPGAAVASLGYPEGIFSATRQMRIVGGVVSHTRFPLGQLPQRRWIVSDVRLREGNSGGPLVDVQGRVVGINTIRRLDGETSLSVPIDEVYQLLAELLAQRERTARETAGRVERVRRDLGWCRRTLEERPVGLGEVSGRLVARQIADAERLADEAATSFMTGQWVQARTQLDGAELAMRWLRSVLGLGE
jgi:S1-C subfamily serine protease